MEIRQLRYAVAIADTGTFTAAARRCFVAQPSLSQSIGKLEAELGVELFARIGRAVRLTPAGEALVGAARLAIRTFDAIGPEVAAVTGVIAGHLDLVALPTLAQDPVATLVGAFCRRHPGVTVRLAHPEGTDDLLASIRRGDGELGITETPARRDGLVVTPFGRQEIVAVAPPGTQVAGPLGATELARFPLITHPTGTSTRALLDRFLATAGLTATIAVETDQRELIVPLVLQGAGVALLPRPIGDHAAAQGASVFPVRPALWRDLAVVRREGTPSPAVRAFVDLLPNGA